MAESEKIEPGIPLAKAIQDLRSELMRALAEGQDKALRFKLEPVELELNVAMTLQAGMNAGVKFWVVDLGAKGELERSQTHKLKLTLNPVDKDGNQFMIRDTVDIMPE